MAGFNDMMHDLVNKDYDELLFMGKVALVDSFKIMSTKTDEDGAVAFVVTFLASALASDGKFTPKEHEFVSDLLGQDADLLSIMKNIDGTAYAKLNAIVDSLAAEEKAKLCFLAACAAAVDKTIDPNELKYLIDLME